MSIVVTPKGTNYKDNAGTTLEVGSLTITAGASLMVGVLMDDTGAAISSVIYNDGATDYELTAIPINVANNCEIWLYYLDNVAAASGSGYVRITLVSEDDIAMAVYQVTGLGTSNSLDKTATATDRATSLDSGNTATTAQNDEVCVGIIGCDSAVTVNSYDGTCNENTYHVSGPYRDLIMATKVVSSIGTYNMAITLAAKEYSAMGIATFKGYVEGSSDIKSVAGVSQANIKKVAGVAEADIKKVAGVAN